MATESLPSPIPPVTVEPESPPAPILRTRRPNPRIAQMKRTWYFLRRNTLAMVGLGVILLFVGVAIYASTQTSIPYTVLTTYSASEGVTCQQAQIENCVCTYFQGTVAPGPNCYQTPQSYPAIIAPTFDANHFSGGPLPLGSLTTANPGTPLFFNVYDGLLRGADWTLTISITIVSIGAFIGLLVGSISGFFGGAVDEAIMRFVDIFLSIPQFLFVIVTVAALDGLPFFSSFSARIGLLIMAFVITWWPFYARIVRSQVLVVREQKYVEAARASGASKGRIIVRHIVPNSVYPVFVQMSLDVGGIPLLLGALIYLNFPIFSTVYFPEWGSMSALSVTALTTFLDSCQLGTCSIPWWQFTFPGLAIFLFAISVNFFSDGLRDALDPRLRR
ncbi:MAG: ABC transporter permease [Thermoplasmata archaeon]|jgi:peptide/nickel transport system permease protein